MLFDKLCLYAESEKVAIDNYYKKITYKELYSQLCILSNSLSRLKFRPKDVVILCIDSQIDFVILFLSFLLIGCWVMPIIDKDDAEKLICKYKKRGAKIFDNGLYNSIKDDKNSCKSFSFPDEEKCGIYHLTSGTTAHEKVCVRTLSSLCKEGMTYKKLMKVNSSKSILSVAPIYHSFALGAAFMTAFMSGCTLFLTEEFVPRRVLKVIELNKIQILVLVPIMVKLLLRTNTNKKYTLNSVETALVGAGQVTQELYDQMRNKYGIDLCANYGSTETGGIISRMTSEPVLSVGKPMEGVCIKICNSCGDELEIGNVGELRVKAAYMMKGYAYESNDDFDAEGYFITGDLGYIDDNKNVFIVGRLKKLINVGGKKVNPYEVEEVIRMYPGVQDCIVVKGVKNDKSEYVKAIIVGQGITKHEIYKHCIKKMTMYKCPTQIEFVPFIKRNLLGKSKL
ncbi:AMP-binding protein [Blautia pseudococcoides]|uniref:class I adenylate-forming enzyme family protein n=1 Tax=Blautia pseudococcoides TaxID=1796616 RepID=UPI00148B252E|nr:fatty acid--CoA ligase family protein [Blautia pseudococcoides]QJU15958.1 AMP-binding protein [Blautia pseudococcoides]